MRSSARRLDEVAANATVAPLTRLVDGWLAKAAPDLPFRRCNAVLPPPGAADHPDAASAVLDELAGWYRSMDQRLIVQVSAADPEAHVLDALLAARGLAVEAPVDVLVAPLPGLAAPVAAGDGPAGVEVDVVVGVDAAWAERYGAVHGDDAASRARVEAYGRMLAALGPAAVAAVARRDGDLAGVGFGVLERGWLGVFGMGTAPVHRRRGVAGAVLAGLAAAGLGLGASRAYLQVEQDNPAAQALYRGLGFTLHHAYHYRASGPDGV